MLNIEQEIQPVINKLPLMPSEMPLFACRKSNPNSPDVHADFIANKNKILSWLVWLKNNNRHHTDITIDCDALDYLPVDGSACNQLRSCSLDDDDSDEDGALADGPNQSNATGPLPDEENAHVSQSHVHVNPLLQAETNDENMTGTPNEKMGTADNPLPFPLQMNRSNDCAYPSV